MKIQENVHYYYYYYYPVVKILYPDSSTYCEAAITAVSIDFSKRLDHNRQCPKFSDVWPIQGIIKEKRGRKKCEKKQLQRKITQAC